MNKKIFVIVSIIAFSLILNPLTLAAPGGSKANEKFQSFELLKVSGPPAVPPVFIYHPEPPKDAEMTRLIIQETMSSAEIKINGGTPYLLNVDFTYTAMLTIDYHNNRDPLFATITVDQVFEFLPASGIDGGLEILAKGRLWPDGKDGLGTSESWTVNIGHGTGDLKGVKILAEAYFVPAGIEYVGIVTNWP
jgi:hypothetical protein